MAAPEIHFKNRALTSFLEEVGEAWCDLRPDSAAEFTRIVREHSGNLIKPSAMSQDGNFLELCHIPNDLYSFIKQEYRKRFEDRDFFADRDNYYLLCKVWPAIRVKRKPTPFFQVPNLTD